MHIYEALEGAKRSEIEENVAAVRGEVERLESDSDPRYEGDVRKRFGTVFLAARDGAGNPAPGVTPWPLLVVEEALKEMGTSADGRLTKPGFKVEVKDG